MQVTDDKSNGREVNVCIVFGNGETIESTCSNQEFASKLANKLKIKEVVGYIKEFTDTGSISFFIKSADGIPFDFFRLKEFNYYNSRIWSYKKVDKDIFDLYLTYLSYKQYNCNPGGRKFILKKIEGLIR